MLSFGIKKCAACGKELSGGDMITKNVRVFGRTDEPKRHFCSEEHLKIFQDHTAKLMLTRRPRCMRC